MDSVHRDWEAVVTRRALLFAGTVIGQIVYFIAIADAWRAVGWVSKSAVALNLCTVFLLCLANPCVCAYVASRLTWNSGRVLTVNVCILFFSILLVCIYVNEIIWLNSSGYGSYLATPGPDKYPGETLAWNQMVVFIEMIITGILFVVSYSIISRGRNESFPN